MVKQVVEAHGFILHWSVAFEGGMYEEFGNLDQFREWIKNNQGRFDFNLDNLTLYPRVGELDIYKVVSGELQ
jgi:hypothetical protein